MFFVGQQKRSGAVVDIAPEHIHGRKRIIVTAIAKARSVLPDDAACFLKGPIEKDETTANGTDIRSAADGLERRLQRSRKHLRVVIQDEKKFALRFFCSLIHT